MDIYFLRHGLAGQHGDPKYKDDSLRPLTVDGQEKMCRAVLGMQILNLEFDAILSSPYLRARQTAEIVARTYNIKNNEIYLTTHLLPPASVKDLIKEARRLFPKSKNLLFVGHEPHLTEMISSLLGCDGTLGIDFKKGGLCCLSLQQGSPRLNWLLTPSQLRLFSKEKQRSQLPK